MNFCMLRFTKKIAWLMLALLCAGVQPIWAFSLKGPPVGGVAGNPDNYQVPALFYNLATDLGAPKQEGQEFRRVTPILYIACDDTFKGFFGDRGIAEVDKAFAILNNVTNVSRYTESLVEFPEEAQLVNLRASALSLTDLKSVVLGGMMEQFGLYYPTRAVWVIRQRTQGVPCPTANSYVVTKRNLDIIPGTLNTSPYTSYVNGTLYSYFILENCTGPNLADAVEFPVDPLARTYTAVTDWANALYVGLDLTGGYYTGLTRDDVAGIRYLYRTNNYNRENAGPDTFQFVTNLDANAVQLLGSQDLSLLASAALVNNDAALAALFPGLQFSAPGTTIFTNVGTPNVIGYFTNSPFDPAGTAPHIPVIKTNGWTTNIVQLFTHQFANVITNSYSPKSKAALLQTTVTSSPFSPAGSPPVTNSTFKPLLLQQVSGDFFIIPANLCGFNIVRTQLATTLTTTNPVLTVTFGLTNAGNTSTTIVSQVSQSIVTYFTSNVVVINPVTCPADTVDTRQGVEKLTFLRRDVDSLLGQFFQPITNDYTLMAVTLTNGPLVPQHIRRIVTAPDILYTVQDLPNLLYVRNLNFNDANRPANLAGPGTIESPTTFTFDSSGPLYANAFSFAATNFFLNPTEATQQPGFFYGSFDGSTNDPVVYPNGTTLGDLENLLLSPFIVTGSIPNAHIGVNYSTQFTGIGGQPPYTWSLIPGSALPSGLNLSSDGVISGTPDGPAATYDFTIRITDTAANFRDIPFTLTIDP
jgi:hypothetical protein